ncbi:MAG TPA: tetratricopeptide repeat-containing glycosyltransferase family protein [Alphaproteobacteria bacterium]|jgi:tetratricopeptide (TPR) repeat protein|nr:tetratricopeptide repeat-containing glycosyltransferase family protein [Alphaproteobacteria bacterium]MDP7427117.1 tetratricopeptide repeat-containing glycosyltransferase family protein [Alphaproteobacteria bacterium]HJM48687.1 tetratricopeptide repeat-containing glycosyltransferase family protein [Alphaproteobacteria bacterium]
MSGNAEPPSADDLAARAVEMIGRQRFDEAEALAREALAAAPRHLTANLARAACARARGALDVAEGCLEVVLADHPASAAGHSSLGMVRLRQERLEEAEGLFAKAVALDPKDAVNAFRWGECLRRLGRLEAAETAFVEALRRQPDQTDTLFQLATVRGEMGRSEEACGLLERLLAVDPENASARFNLGFHYLRLGRLAAGWPLYEARWQHPEAPARRFAETPWDGSEAGARHLLVHAEQGLGDAIQFVRFVPQLAARAERVTLLCQRSLLGLFRRSLALEVLGFEDPLPPAHGHVPLLSLPGLLGTTLEKLPAEVPYLHPRETASLPGQPAIGICWAGNPEFSRNQARSCPAALFAALLQGTGATFYGLKKDASGEDLALFAESGRFVDLAAEWQDFEQSATALAGLDLVITTDTVVAHLAGALGRPTWLLLHQDPDWRWRLEGETSPWYPNTQALPPAPARRLDGTGGARRQGTRRLLPDLILPRPSAMTGA